MRELHQYQKGDVIHTWELEKESGHVVGSDAYKLYCLGLKDSIEKQIYRDRQEIVVVVCRRNEIRILTDEEATVDRENYHTKAVLRSYKGFRQLLGVDRRNLSEESQQQHDRRVKKIGLQDSALRRSRKSIDPEPVQRIRTR